MKTERPLRAAVLLSGGGRTLENLIKRRDQGGLAVEFTGVVSSRKNVRGVDVARAAGIPCDILSRKSHASDESFSTAVTEAILKAPPDIVLMAGFLSLYLMPRDWIGRVVNIHPSLLPLFGGKGYFGHHVHEAVLASGMRVSGCTVHYVDTEFDHGPVIHQRACAVLPSDDAETLAARVFAEECEALPAALEWIRRGWVRYEAGRTVYAPEFRLG